MEEDVRNAVFGNVGSTISFRVGPFDAEVLETIFTPRFLAADLVNLGAYQIYLTLMIDGIGSQPFSAVTLPAIQPPRISCRDMVIAASQQNYATRRVEVEKIITDLHAPVEPPPKKPVASTGEGNNPSGEKKVTTTNSNGNGSNGNGAKKPSGNGSNGHSQSKSSTTTPVSKTKPVEQKPDRPKPRPDFHKDQTAEGLRSILAKIAAVSEADDATPAPKAPTIAPSASVPATDRREALRSVLGSVLETTPVTPATQTPTPTPTLPSTTEYAPLPHEADQTEPDIKTIKKILGNDARVKSPFS
jgi:hypothetical protein